MSGWEREAGTEVCVNINTGQINKPQTFRKTLSFDYVVQEQSLFQALCTYFQTVLGVVYGAGRPEVICSTADSDFLGIQSF